jgi:hypothetical protein
MSFQAMCSVIKRDIPNSPAKFVLLMIANYADEDGKAWPSITTLARDTALCEKTVRKALKWLVEGGFLARESRSGKSDVLRLTPPTCGTPPLPHVAPEPITNLPIEPANKGAQQNYAFNVGRFRVTETDLARWVKAFPAINVEGVLHANSHWLAKAGEPFHAAANLLAKKEAAARLDFERVKAQALANANKPRRGSGIIP